MYVCMYTYSPGSFNNHTESFAKCKMNFIFNIFFINVNLAMFEID